jgi:predicted 2-oxoglutarate/Fe(II)-dependent dioxygenase YbiX
MSYQINGIGVGQNPENIKRDQTYLTNFEKLGDSKDNIKVISGFISDAECDQILSHIDSMQTNTNNITMWDGRAYNNNQTMALTKELEKLIRKTIEQEYKVKVDISQYPSIIKWSKGQSMGYHVDDLGISEYHITGIIYLNDNYTGGEISFLTQDTIIKPNKGDLIMFPGNLHYAHQVKEILSGDRYTIPVWYKFI